MIAKKLLWLAGRFQNSSGCIFLAALLLLAAILPAQVKENVQGMDSAEAQYIRRLTWTKDEYALRYEVAIEKYEDGEYRGLLREYTDASSFQVNLPAGQYRCRVTPYDYLEKPREGSQWINFEVRTAVASRFTETDKVEIVIEHSAPEPKAESPLESPPEKNKLFNLYLGAAWEPLIPLYGENNPFFGKSASLAGAALRFGVISSGEHFFNLGLELAGSWYASKTDFSGTKETIQVMTIDLNLVVQKRLPNRNTALRYRLGAGFSFFPGSREITSSLSFKEYIHINTGFSFLWLVTKQFYLEAGFDYSHLLTEDPAGCFRPWAGLGWQF